jgi:hypothetical protein
MDDRNPRRGSTRDAEHSVHSWDLWEKAGFAVEDARKNALAAKQQSEGGLREADCGIMTTDR